MNKVLYIILISLFSLTVFSCSDEEEEYTETATTTTDTTAPVIAEVTAVTTPTTDTTPNYTFSSDEAGTITYGGSCSSSTTSAVSGNNTITFTSLSDGTYSDCTIIVKDSSGNASNTLSITSFEVLLSYVAVGSSGKTLTSSDGTSWTSRISGTTSNLVGVTYGNSKFLSLLSSWTGVIGTSDNGSHTTGTIFTSSNGTSWTSSSATCRTCDNNTVSINDVTYGNSTFVAVGQSGRILTSSNGTSWTTRTSGTTSNLIGVTYGNSTFLTLLSSSWEGVVGNSDNGSHTTGTVLTSSNGTTWTSTSTTCSTCDNSTFTLKDVTSKE